MLQEYLGYCLVVPLLIGLAGMLLAGRLPLGLQSLAAATAPLLAFVVSGFLLLGKNIHQPERHWHWLPALAVLSWLVGLLGFRAGSRWLERLVWSLLLGGVAAWLLVPTWKDLADQRWFLVAGLALALTGLMLATAGLGRRFSPQFLLLGFGLTAFLGAGWIGAGYSLTNARWLLITAGTSAGMILAALLPQPRPCLNCGVFVPLFAVWLLGGLFIGAIEPNPPRYEILLLAALPPILLAVANGLRGVFQGAARSGPRARM